MSLSPITGTPSTAPLCKLSLNEQVIYTYLRDQIGTSKIPVSVPLWLLNKKLGLSYRQIRYAINKLISKGYIEKWTATHQHKTRGVDNFQKTNYYRIKI
jgi:hypothetical protein